MRLEEIGGVCMLDLTTLGYEAYETPDDVSEREATNWLETDIRVRTPHGWGASQVACMQTWDATYFADWLDKLSRHRIGMYEILFPEPNLALRAVAFFTHQVRLTVWFILEKPGEWYMDDTPNQVSSDCYFGEMSFNVSRASLHTAAESLRVELKRFPGRDTAPKY